MPAAFAEIKSRLKGPTVAAMDAATPDDSAFLQRWFDPEVQKMVGAAVARLVDRS